MILHGLLLGLLQSLDVTWLTWLLVAVIITAVAAVTGLKPKGTRPIAHTRMMGMARFFLLMIVIVLAYLAYRSR